MKKLRFCTLILLLSAMCLCLCLGQTAAAADDFMEEGDWNNDNFICVEIEPEYVEYVLEDVSGAFADLLDLKATYVTEKFMYPPYCNLSLRLVLNNGGQTEQDAAIDQLVMDERVRWAGISDVVPYETINTLALNASSDTVKVGDTITVKLEGDFKMYYQPYTFDSINVRFAEYDPGEEYTPEDFPQIEVASVEKVNGIPADYGYLHLKLVNPGYFNCYKAIHALAVDPSFITVVQEQLSGYVLVAPEWIISDTSIADFVDLEEYPPSDYDKVPKDVTIKGLKPGKVTVTYIPGTNYYGGWDYPVSCEIIVTEDEVITTTEADIVTTTTAKEVVPPVTTQGNESPATGDSDSMAAIALVMSFAAFAVLVLTGLKRKAF